RFQRTAAAGFRPITPYHLAVLLRRHAVGQFLGGGAAVDILVCQMDEVLLAKASVGLRARGHRLGQRHLGPGVDACLGCLPAIVAAIGHRLELVDAENLLGLRGHAYGASGRASRRLAASAERCGRVPAAPVTNGATWRTPRCPP